MKRSKVLCLFLALMMLFTIMPSSVFADNHIHDECDHIWFYDDHEHVETCEHFEEDEHVHNDTCKHDVISDNMDSFSEDIDINTETLSEDQSEIEDEQIAEQEYSNEQIALHDAFFSNISKYEVVVTAEINGYGYNVDSNNNLYRFPLLFEENGPVIDNPEDRELLVGDVSSFILFEDYILYLSVAMNSIVKSDSLGNNPEIIVVGETGIDTFHANNDIMFYAMGVVLYRYHFESGITDIGASVGTVQALWPVSVNDVGYVSVNPNYDTYVLNTGDDSGNNNLVKKTYSFSNNQIKNTIDIEPAQSDMSISMAITGVPDGQRDYESTNTYAYNGLTVPVGEFYYAPDDYTYPAFPRGSTWLARGFANGYTCYGFAKYVFYRAYSVYVGDSSRPTMRNSRYGYANDTAFLNDLAVGAHIRLNGHSMILVYREGQRMTFYQANGESQNLVSTITFSDYTHLLNYWGYTLEYNDQIKNEHAHTFSTSYSSDGTYHWNICTRSGCDVKQNYGTHNSGTPIDNGNGTHSVKCTICTRTLSTSNHSYANPASISTSEHRLYCACGVTTTTFHSMRYASLGGGTHSKYCGSSCGYSVTEGHSLSITSRTSTQHTYSCSYCSHTSTTNHSFSTVNNGGTHTRTCSVCAYKITTQHSYGAWGYSSATQHKRTCTLCPAYETGNHTMSTTKTSTNHTQKCSTCGYGVTAQHGSWTYGTTWTKVSTASTCRKRLKYCGVCNYSVWDYDYVHNYPLIGKQCKDCNYKIP